MDVSYLSALAGLAGAAIGGFTSFGSTWLTQRAQLQQQRLDTARKQRERIFVDFLNEASRLYGDALGHEKNDVLDLVKLFATASHLRMVCTPSTVESKSSGDSNPGAPSAKPLLVRLVPSLPMISVSLPLVPVKPPLTALSASVAWAGRAGSTTAAPARTNEERRTRFSERDELRNTVT